MILLNNNFNICFLAVYPELYLLFAVILIISFLVIFDNFFKQKFNLIKLSAVLYIYSLLFVFLLNILLSVSNFSIFYNSLIITEFVLIIKNILIILLIIISFISLNYFKFENIYIYEFFILLNLITLGLFILVEANDLLVMYMGIEIISLSFYILTSSKIHSNFSTEAGMKYFILGAFSSGLLLYGSSLIYGSIGSINFSDISAVSNYTTAFFLNFVGLIEEFDIEDNYIPTIIYYYMLVYNFVNFDPLIIGLIFVLIGLLFKLGAAPFHMWLPDVYEGAPTIITFIFSVVPKIVIFTLILNFNLHFYYLDNVIFFDMFYYVSILSIIIGSLGALYQTKIKRLLAYSAINHVGFLLIGLLVFTSFSISSLFLYLIIYIIISINIFLFLFMFRKYDNNLKLKKINEYVSIFKSHPILAINFSIILFSVAGIPPLAGFYSKFYIFVSAFNSLFYSIVVIAAIFSVLSSLYYIRLIKLMFFKNFEYWMLFQNINRIESIFCSSILFFNILFFCYPEILIIYLTNNILGL